MKIKIKLYEGAQIPVSKKGGWFDIFMPSAGCIEGPIANRLSKKKTVRNVEFHPQMVSLGFALAMPSGWEAIIAPRSSTYPNFSCGNTNYIGIIEDTYCGDDDIWKSHIKADKNTSWKAGDRLFQFRFQLSQKATVWQKIKYLFWNGKIEFIPVHTLGNTNRGGFGSTGK